jgi:hypothetical protein
MMMRRTDEDYLHNTVEQDKLTITTIDKLVDSALMVSAGDPEKALEFVRKYSGHNTGFMIEVCERLIGLINDRRE